MNTHNLTIYDDGHGRFGPIITLRAVFQLRTGARTTHERIEQALGSDVAGFRVPERLVGVVRESFPGASVNETPGGNNKQLLVNGRWLGERFVEEIRTLALNQALVQGDGQVVAVCLSSSDANGFLRDGGFALPDHTSTIRLNDRALIDRPWHILDELNANLLADLQASQIAAVEPDRLANVTMFGEHAVKIGQSATLLPQVVINSEQGPVVIDEGALIHPLAVLQGPCYIGPDSTVMPHACIRPNTVIGPGCKVGGEVSASIIHGYSNKSHEGYLGDSLVGAWVNLGAGTNTSNLKNTYGPVRAQLDDGGTAMNTGRTFFGSIIGDHVRSAIGTRLPTGAVIQTGCMLAGDTWAPKYAKALGFYNGAGRQPYDPDKLIATIQTAMARRDMRLSDAERELILSLA